MAEYRGVPGIPRHIIEALFVEAVARYRHIDQTADSLVEEIDRVKRGVYEQDIQTWRGEATGILVAICVLAGWNPTLDSLPEGKAESAVLDWWETQEPTYWRFAPMLPFPEEKP